MLAGVICALAGGLLSLAGPGKVSSCLGWGALSVAVVLPPVAAPCKEVLLVLRLLFPCAA